MGVTQHPLPFRPLRSRPRPVQAMAWTVLLTLGLLGAFGVLGVAPAGAATVTGDTLPVFSLYCEVEGPGIATLFTSQQGPELIAGSALWAPGTSPETDPPQFASQKVVEHLPRQTFAACLVPGDGYELGLLVLTEHGHTFAQLAVFPSGEEDAVVFGFGDVELGQKTLTGTFPVFDPRANRRARP